jgi:hypothetical protein
MTSANDLVTKARFLRNAAPQQFSDFLGAFAEYTRVSAEIMIDATENLQRWQGHAQQAKNILALLEKAKNG